MSIPVRPMKAMSIGAVTAAVALSACGSPKDAAEKEKAREASVRADADALWASMRSATEDCDSRFKTAADAVGQASGTEVYMMASIAQDRCDKAKDALKAMRPPRDADYDTKARFDTALKACVEAYESKSTAAFQLSRIANGQSSPSDIASFGVASNAVQDGVVNCGLRFAEARGPLGASEQSVAEPGPQNPAAEVGPSKVDWSTPHEQFDLECSQTITATDGTSIESKSLTTIDLAKGQWCEASCDNINSLTKESGYILLYDDASKAGTSYSQKLSFYPTDMTLRHEIVSAGKKSAWSESCRYKPFSKLASRPPPF